MKPTFVIINGLAESGKDTFVKFVSEELKKAHPTWKIQNLHRSDIAKDTLISWGWDGIKTVEVRKLLKSLVDFQEKSGFLKNWVQEHVESNDFTFLHVREPSSVAIYTKMFELCSNVVSVLVKRDVVKEPDLWGIKESEKLYEVIVDNNKTLDELKSAAKGFASLYGGMKDGCE